MVYILSDKIQEFIDWLEKETDFVDWHPRVKKEVHKKLIDVMTSELGHDWQWYMNGTFCRKCNAQIGTSEPCQR
jgi:hypothetical protein